MNDIHLAPWRNVESFRDLLSRLLAPKRSSLLPSQYLLGIDIWEGQGVIDWAALEAGGVQFAFVRLNNMSGGHHRDTMFDTYWGAKTSIIRIPYFVYNPWVTGSQNAEWLFANMPNTAKAVMNDLEVVYPGYSKDEYAKQVAIFKDLVKVKYNQVIYTAEWFLPNLSSFPKDVGYSWAQYPSSLYLPMSITWDRMRELLTSFAAPSNAAKCPGAVKFWQCSGDKITLPGSSHTMDIQVGFMSMAELKTFAGIVDEPAPNPEPDPEQSGLAEVLTNLVTSVNNLASGIVSGFELIASKLSSSGGSDPGTDPGTDPIPVDVELAGYTGSVYGGIYEIVDVPGDPINQQWDNAVPLFDDEGGDRIQMMEALYDRFMDTLEGFRDLVEKKTVTTDETGKRFILGKAFKGQTVLIGAIGKSGGVLRGRVIGLDNVENNPSTGAVNIAVCSPVTTPHFFHKIPNVRRFIPILSGRGGNHWWIPMSWLKLKKVIQK